MMRIFQGAKSFPKILIGLVAGALVIGSLVSGDERSVAVRFALKELAKDGERPERSRQQRQMKSVVWKKDLAFNEVKGNLFYYLITLRLNDRGEVFLLDSGAHSVRKFSPLGQELQRYGEGRGSGPGELIEPMDFALDDAEDVWIPDQANGAVIAFTKDGKYKTTIRSARTPSRIAFGAQDQMITSSPAQDLFQRTSAQGLSSRTFGRLLDQRPEAFIITDGWMTATGPDRFVYAPLYIGMLVSFGFDGRPLFAVNTIEPAETPKVVVNANGMIRLDPEARPVSYNVTADGGHIFVLARPAESRWLNENGRVIDVYRSTDGAYLYSLPAPEKCKAIAVRGQEIYTLTATNVTRWRFEA